MGCEFLKLFNNIYVHHELLIPSEFMATSKIARFNDFTVVGRVHLMERSLLHKVVIALYQNNLFSFFSDAIHGKYFIRKVLLQLLIVLGVKQLTPITYFCCQIMGDYPC